MWDWLLRYSAPLAFGLLCVAYALHLWREWRRIKRDEWD